jgi:hypothetical protein
MSKMDEENINGKESEHEGALIEGLTEEPNYFAVRYNEMQNELKEKEEMVKEQQIKNENDISIGNSRARLTIRSSGGAYAEPADPRLARGWHLRSST